MVFFDLFITQMRKLIRFYPFLVAHSYLSQKVKNIRGFRARSARKSKNFRARSARKQRKTKLFKVCFWPKSSLQQKPAAAACSLQQPSACSSLQPAAASSLQQPAACSSSLQPAAQQSTGAWCKSYGFPKTLKTL